MFSMRELTHVVVVVVEPQLMLRTNKKVKVILNSFMCVKSFRNKFIKIL